MVNFSREAVRVATWLRRREWGALGTVRGIKLAILWVCYSNNEELIAVEAVKSLEMFWQTW